jgi:hypothetical protein
MAKKIKPNNYRPEQQPLPRSYWLIKANGDAQHCHWTGRLISGAPPFEEIKGMLSIQCIEPVGVLYNDVGCVMFIDKGGRLRTSDFNWKASALYVNAAIKRAPRWASMALYTDLTEKPTIHPSLLAQAGAFIVGDVMLWEGYLNEALPYEGAIESVYDKIKGLSV